MRSKTIFLTLAFLLLAKISAADIVIRLDRPIFSPITVRFTEITGPPAEAEFLTKVLLRDLLLHMVFSVVRRPPIEGAGFREYFISGHIESTFPELTLVLRLEDLFKGEVVLQKAFRGSKAAGRYMIHKFFDEAVKEMVGFPGVAYSRVAFVKRVEGRDELWVMDFDHYGMKKIYSAPIILSAALSPDGTKVAFVSFEKGQPEVKLIDFSVGKITTVSSHPGLNSSPVWHPDGKRLVVTLSKDGNPDLYLISLEGKILRRLTHGEGVNIGGSISPDGRYLAFVSDRTGTPQIYLYDFETGGTRRITFSGKYNVSPCWSPLGDRIVYASKEDGRFVLYTVNPFEGSPVRISEDGSFEEPVFGPNGAFVMARGETKTAKGIFLFLSNGAIRTLYLRSPNIISISWSPLP